MSSVFVLAQAAADDPSTLTLIWALLAGNLVGGGWLWWRKQKAKNKKQKAESENQEE